MFGFLRNLGLSVLALRSGMEASDLRDSVAVFNDPDSKVDAMVASIQFATGLNLHNCCCKVAIVEVSLSAANPSVHGCAGLWNRYMLPSIVTIESSDRLTFDGRALR